MDLLVLALAVVLFAPGVLQWSVAVFVLGVLAVCALRGQYASRITLSVARDLGTVAAAVAVPLTVIGALDGFGRSVRPFVAGRPRHVVPAGDRPGRRLRRHPARQDEGRLSASGCSSWVPGRWRSASPRPRPEPEPTGCTRSGSWTTAADESLSRPVLGGIDQIDSVLSDHRIDRVVIAFGVNRDPDLVRVIRSCENAAVDMYIIPRFFELGLQAAPRDVDMVWGYPLVRLRRSTMRSSGRMAEASLRLGRLGQPAPPRWPRSTECWRLAVKLTSPGPVYFRQRRIGKNGREVEILKFRSMRVNSESDTQWSVDDGRPRHEDRRHHAQDVVRRAAPALERAAWRHVAGRAPGRSAPSSWSSSSRRCPGYGDRHRVPVGLTGLAQVNGLRGDTSIEDRAWFDNHYIENWSVSGDLVILARTAGAMIKQVRE